MPLDETIAILAEKAFRDNWFNSTHNLNISKEDLIDLLNVSTKGQLFQFNGALYEQIDGVSMGSPLGPLLANVFMSSLEEKLELEGKLPDYYRRYVDDTLTLMPNITTATDFLNTLNHAHPSDVTRIVIPFKDQDSANIVKTQLKDLSIKLQTTIQPVFVSRKIGQDLQECENKPQLVNQQCVVYQFKCNLCDTGSYVGYTRGHLHARVDGHKSTSSSVRKHYDNDHAGAVPEDHLSCFKVIKKCRTKFDCLVNEMLYIKQLTPSLNVQTDSIRAKVFV